VHFITGPVPEGNLPRHPAVVIERIVSAEHLLQAGQAHFASADAIIYAAAVADYRPATFVAEKMPKVKGAMTLQLESTPDVAATLNRDKRPDQVAVGFALQTHDGPRRAVEKMRAKLFDGVVLNAPDALGGDEGTYTFFTADHEQPDEWGVLAKGDCAARICGFIAGRLNR
jgi:phosphopantothenoylcysteine decarboxylase/phosphopantothenate--cysteine ligase